MSASVPSLEEDYMVRRRSLFVSMIAVPAAVGLLWADPPPHAGKGKNKSGKVNKSKAKNGGPSLYSSGDRRLIHDFYFGPSGPPVFLQNPQPLPPGLQKKLYRTGTLPPGWQKRFVPLDPVLIRQLPPIPAGYDRGFIGANLVLVNRNTSLVVDVLSFLD